MVLIVVHGVRHQVEFRFLLLAWLAVLALIELGTRALDSHRGQLTVYGVEWLAMLGMMSLSALPWFTRVMVAFVFLACNTALWGWRWMVVLSAVGGAMAVSLVWHNAVTFDAPDATIDLAAGIATLWFMLIVCAVAHNQAQVLLQLRHTLADEKHTLLRYLPKNLPSHLAHASTVQRQWLTVVFVDLVGFTRATRMLTADTLTYRLNLFLSVSHTLAEQWGGFVSKFLGDGVLCVFPSNDLDARANKALQAVRFMQQLPNQLNHWPHAELSVTGGVASGECCTGEWGDQTRCDFTVIGTPVNLAFRLQEQSAGYAGLLLDETTTNLTRDALGQGRDVRLELKGLGAVGAYAPHMPADQRLVGARSFAKVPPP